MKRSTSAIRLINRIAATLAATLIVTVAPAAAQDDVYFPASMCLGTDEFGEPWSAIHFRQGVAENFSQDRTRRLVCPVPYVRDLGNLARITVRISAFDNTDDGGISLRLCEKFLDDGFNAGFSCHDTAFSGNGFQGFTALQAEFIPATGTRWVFLEIDIPDQDAQSGRSYVSGYRACRGSC